MKTLLRASIIVSSLLVGNLAAFAAPSGFELDLKELRSTSSGASRSPQARRQTVQKPVKPAVTAPHGEYSTYTVQAGDHLFLILMRQYGLSNDAAERLIPEVMSINNIRTPRALAMGRRLTIPLPARAQRVAASTGTPVKTTPLPPSKTAPSPATTPLATASSPNAVEIVATASCSLGEEFARRLNLLVPSHGIIQGFPNFTAQHAGVTLAVACGLSPEEVYTYGQLLMRHGVQLLAFDGEEPHRRVIEKIANRLHLDYQLDETAGRNKLPLRVFFSSVGPHNRAMRLTVLADNR